jgi:phosphoenolpyruvate phosphomutase
MNKAQRFRKLLNTGDPFFLMEAHDGLSAKIVEESGFPAIWASGLSITASLGVRDNNEISYTQLLDVLEFINDACDLPVLVDGDTGYGNFNNACRLLQKLEQLGIAAICIEDKKFPKTNSFLETKLDALADPQEFAGKIRAMKATQKTPDFTVVARLESLVIGAGVEDAVKRAELYLNAGADALLVHSKRQNSKDIDDFLSAFSRTAPIFLVPTKYYSVPVRHLLRDERVRGIIWANHNVRACITAMQEVSKRIYTDGSIARVEETIAPVSEVFRLQKNQEYLEMEKRYLPAYPDLQAAILAAGGPGSLDFNRPKALLSVNGKSILSYQLDVLRSLGIANISVIRGFKKETIPCTGVSVIDNEKWNVTSAAYSLALAAETMNQPYLVLYGDVFFKKYLLREVVDCAAERVSADIILVCVKENYIDAGYSLGLNKRPNMFGSDSDLTVTHVYTEEKGHEDQFLVYFSGLMMINNPPVVKQLLPPEIAEHLHTADFMRSALAAGLTLAVVMSSCEAIVDINSLTDLLKAGEI